METIYIVHAVNHTVHYIAKLDQPDSWYSMPIDVAMDRVGRGKAQFGCLAKFMDSMDDGSPEKARLMRFLSPLFQE